MERKVWLIGAALAVLVLASVPAQAGPIYGFRCITWNVAAQCATAPQYTVEVINLGSNQVAFEFKNTATVASSITDVYFQDGSLLGISSIQQSSGVSFGTPAAPPDLPGGNSITPAFVTTSGFSADSNPPVLANGVNASSEWVRIVFSLQTGKTYSDVIAAINYGLNPGLWPNPTIWPTGQALRIGIHVQGIGAGGGSESFVLVPEPGFYGLLGLGLAGLFLAAARRRRTA